KTGLAVGKEAAVCDLPLEARLLGLRSRDLLLGRSDFRVVRASDLVRRLGGPRCRRLAQLVVDRPAVDHLRDRQLASESTRRGTVSTTFHAQLVPKLFRTRRSIRQ